jgi:hypothetical protein
MEPVDICYRTLRRGFNMFCPNCGAENNAEQNYCRGCGLRLDTIMHAVNDQFPSKEYAELQRRRQIFQNLGLFSLSAAGLIAVGFVLFKAAYYKLILLGPDVLFGSAIAALVGFLLLSVFFFNFPKFFMRFERLERSSDRTEKPKVRVNTNKLIEDPIFEPVPSVTEHSTELLPGKTRLRTK